ncbi:MAG TPA: hypothetical protein VKT49_10030 [Bryobacteraceae bacterium]|nr:hypothetical protein [Bryobacteraceae bacterium]
MRSILHIFFAAVAAAAVVDRVAVVVGNDVITETEVNEELRLEEFMQSQAPDFSPQQRRAAADRLVDQQLIRQEMEVAHYQAPDPSKADAMVRNLRRQRYPGDAEFRAALERYGLTEGQVKQYLLWQLTVIQFTDERFHPDVQENPEPSANREARAPESPATKPPESPARPQSADRLAPGAAGVDQQLDAWLKQARANTHIDYKQEAFQ